MRTADNQMHLVIPQNSQRLPPNHVGLVKNDNNNNLVSAVMT